MWCKGENSTRECSNVGWSSVFVSLRVICGVFGKSFRIWKQENKQKKSLKASEQTNVICWRGQKDSRILLAKRSSPSIPARKYWLESVFDSVAQIRKLLLFFFSLHRRTFDNFSCLILTLSVVNNRKILINIHSFYFKIVLIKIDFETHWFPNKNQRYKSNRHPLIIKGYEIIVAFYTLGSQITHMLKDIFNSKHWT